MALSGEAAHLVSTMISEAGGLGFLPTILAKLEADYESINTELQTVVANQVDSSVNYLDLITRGNSAVQTINDDVETLLELAGTSKEFPTDIISLIELTGRAQSNIQMTHDLFQKIASVPHQILEIEKYWENRIENKATFIDVQRRLFGVMEIRGYVHSLADSYLEDTLVKETTPKADLEAISADLKTILADLDRTFFASMMAFKQKLDEYLVMLSPGELLTRGASDASFAEGFLTILLSQENLSPGSLGGIWAKIVRAVVYTIIPERYADIVPKAAATYGSTDSKAAASFTNTVLADLMERIRQDLRLVVDTVGRVFAGPAPNELLSYVRSKAMCIHTLAEKGAPVSVGEIFDIVKLFATAIHRFVRSLLLRPPAQFTDNQGCLYLVMNFVSSYSYELNSSLGINWMVPSYPNLTYFQNAIKNDTRRGISQYYAEWYYSLTGTASTATLVPSYSAKLGGIMTLTKPSQHQAPKNNRAFSQFVGPRFTVQQGNAGLNDANDPVSTPFTTTAMNQQLMREKEGNPFADSPSLAPLVNLIETTSIGEHISVTEYLEDAVLSCTALSIPALTLVNRYAVDATLEAWRSMAPLEKRNIVHRIADITGVTRTERELDKDIARKPDDMFFQNALSLEKGMASIIERYEQDISAKFHRACANALREYSQSLSSPTTTTTGEIYSGVVSGLFTMVREQLDLADASSDIGQRLYTGIYKSACHAFVLLLKDIYSLASLIFPPLNLQYLAGIQGTATKFEALLTSQVFWSSITRNDLNQKLFAFMPYFTNSGEVAPISRVSECYFTGENLPPNRLYVSDPPDNLASFTSTALTSPTAAAGGKAIGGFAGPIAPFGSKLVDGDVETRINPLEAYSRDTIWKGINFAVQECVCLANDVDQVSEFLIALRDHVMHNIKANSKNRSIIEESTGKVNESVGIASRLLLARLAYTLLIQYKSSVFADLFTENHNADTLQSLQSQFVSDFQDTTKHLAGTLQKNFQTEISYMLPATYLCAFLWRYNRLLNSSDGNSGFNSIQFTLQYEKDAKTLTHVLSSVGVRRSVCDSRERMLLAIAPCMKSLQPTLNEILKVSAIGGAAALTLLIVHPMTTKSKLDTYLKDPSLAKVGALEYFRSSPLDRAVVLGPVDEFLFRTND